MVCIIGVETRKAESDWIQKQGKDKTNAEASAHQKCVCGHASGMACVPSISE